jgi:GT2 family glycosyltransferase
MSITIVIPFHRNLRHLEQSLGAARRAAPSAEIVVAADGATEEYQPIVAAAGARIVVVPGPSGPAVARNRAAALATGDIVVFIDADVVVHPDAVTGMCAVLTSEPDLVAIFGSYDLAPAEPDFWSQYKNLSHAYVHQIGSPEATTFWAGLGAVRTDAFRRVGGFDERFPKPCVEDIELGYRLRRDGGRIRLDPRFRGQHLKRWTLWGSVRTDIVSRGVPWAQLIRKFGAMRNDLNLRWQLRASVACAYVFLAALLAAVLTPWSLVVAAMVLVALWGLNSEYYGWFARQRGAWFAARVVPAHLLHHLCNGVSFVAGTALGAASAAGWSLPGVIPMSIWTPTGARASGQ